MRGYLNKKTGLILSSIMLSGAVCSASFDTDELAKECLYLGASLSQLSKANSKEHCTVDINYSGIMMEQSFELIKAQRIQFAIDNLSLVYRALERVRSDRKSCSYFSSMMIPYLEKTDDLTRKLNFISHRLEVKK